MLLAFFLLANLKMPELAPVAIVIGADMDLSAERHMRATVSSSSGLASSVQLLHAVVLPEPIAGRNSETESAAQRLMDLVKHCNNLISLSLDEPSSLLAPEWLVQFLNEMQATGTRPSQIRTLGLSWSQYSGLAELTYQKILHGVDSLFSGVECINMPACSGSKIVKGNIGMPARLISPRRRTVCIEIHGNLESWCSWIENRLLTGRAKSLILKFRQHPDLSPGLEFFRAVSRQGRQLNGLSLLGEKAGGSASFGSDFFNAGMIESLTRLRYLALNWGTFAYLLDANPNRQSRGHTKQIFSTASPKPEPPLPALSDSEEFLLRLPREAQLRVLDVHISNLDTGSSFGTTMYGFVRLLRHMLETVVCLRRLRTLRFTLIRPDRSQSHGVFAQGMAEFNLLFAESTLARRVRPMCAERRIVMEIQIVQQDAAASASMFQRDYTV